MNPDPLVGRSLSHYQIIARLGGGMGVVYETEDFTLRRLVELKFLPEVLVQDPAVRGRFHMGHLTLFAPLQILLRAIVLQKLALSMPVLYIVFGLPVDVLIILAFYFWG
jgi:hypothetical protein